MAWVFLVLSSIFAFNGTGLVFSNYPVIITSVFSLISNAIESKNIRNFVLLYAVAYVIGTLAEAVGLKWGLFFGSYYYTLKDSGVFNVPLQVSLFWGNFYYLSHLFANRLSKKYLYFYDAAIMVGIDLLLDPVMVRLGAWKWKDGGAYFGIPTANFVGWFLVSLLISVLVRKVFKIKILDKNSFGLVSLAIVLTYLVLMFGRSA